MSSTPSTTTSNAAGNMPEPIPEVALVNEGGGLLGHKPRGLLQKTDVVHSVFVLICTPQRQLVLSKVNGGLSATAVTMCKRDEDAPHAAARALLPRHIALHHLGDQLYRQPDGRALYMSAFYGVASLEPHESYELLEAAALDARAPDFTPALQFILQSYRSLLPV